ncbi:MAG: hypothetical protein HGA44_05920 [Cellulomonadaceae bacterium]|nr:hypothetical protein [Cellulomonadaceae bacterium]
MNRLRGARQRSAGSRTVPDVLKMWAGSGRRPDEDRRLIVAGGEVGMVFRQLRDDRRPTRGVLILGTTDAAAASLRAVLGDPPYTITSVDTPTSSPMGSPFMSDVTGEARAGGWRVSVPSVDVETFRGVLEHLSGTHLQSEVVMGVTVLRARMWTAVVWLIGAVTAFTGIASAGAPDQSIDGVLVPLALMAVPGTFFALRAPFVRLVANSEGFTYHGWFCRVERPWTEVVSVELDLLDDRVVAAALVPVAVLKDGSRVRFDALAGYATSARAGGSRMARQAAHLESMRVDRSAAGREAEVSVPGAVPPRYRTIDSGSLGWPAYAFLVVLGCGLCWLFVPVPWSSVLSGLVVVVVIALALGLRRSRTTIEISGTIVIRGQGAEVEEFELGALVDASYHWVPYYGSVVQLRWNDGRSLEVSVTRSTRDLRAALRDAIADARPAAVLTDPRRRSALRRAGLA